MLFVRGFWCVTGVPGNYCCVAYMASEVGTVANRRSIVVLSTRGPRLSVGHAIETICRHGCRPAWCMVHGYVLCMTALLFLALSLQQLLFQDFLPCVTTDLVM